MANGKNMSIDVNRCEMKTVCELVFDLLGRSVERLLSHTHTRGVQYGVLCDLEAFFFYSHWRCQSLWCDAIWNEREIDWNRMVSKIPTVYVARTRTHVIQCVCVLAYLFSNLCIWVASRSELNVLYSPSSLITWRGTWEMSIFVYIIAYYAYAPIHRTNNNNNNDDAFKINKSSCTRELLLSVSRAIASTTMTTQR